MEPRERKAHYVVLQYAPPACLEALEMRRTNIGVVLLDLEIERLYWRIRKTGAGIAREEDAEMVALLDQDLSRMVEQVGARRLFAEIHETFSNIIQLAESGSLWVSDFQATLDNLYAHHVAG